jgi:hypothetical protein
VADRKESELEKTGSSAPQRPAQRQLMNYYIEELEMPFGPRIAWEALASVFLNIAIPALGKKEAITELRRIADWLEHTDTRRPPN